MTIVRSKLFAVGALVVVLAAALATRLLTEDGHAARIENGKPVEVSVDRLRSFARARAVYWAGRVRSTKLELTKTSAGVFVRYLPTNAHVGDRRALFTTIGTYPVRRGYEEALRAQGRHGMVMRRAHGYLAVWSTYRPKSVYLARRGSSILVEVFDPSAGHARELALSGRIRLVR